MERRRPASRYNRTSTALNHYREFTGKMWIIRKIAQSGMAKFSLILLFKQLKLQFRKAGVTFIGPAVRQPLSFMNLLNLPFFLIRRSIILKFERKTYNRPRFLQLGKYGARS